MLDRGGVFLVKLSQDISSKSSATAEDDYAECPSCDSRSIVRDYQRGALVCEKCGRVLKDDVMDRGPEWRAFDQSQRDNRSRSGSPMTYTIHDKGLSTNIDWKNRDAKGKNIPPKKRSQMYRLRKWHRRARISDATERNLAFALSEMHRMSSHLGIPKNVRETASVIYRDAVQKQLIRGRSIEGVVSATIYAASREFQIPRTLAEIAEASRVDKKEIARTYRFLTRELEINLPPTNPISYISRFGSELDLSGVAQSKAIEIIREAKEKGLTSGRGPTGMAAAAIYMTSVITGERRTQSDVAKVAKVTEVTVRNRYKELAEELDIEMDI